VAPQAIPTKPPEVKSEVKPVETKPQVIPPAPSTNSSATNPVTTPAPAGNTPDRPASNSALFKDCADCPEMIALPAGAFRMGSNALSYEKPVHLVTIAKPFAIGVTPITLADWSRCVTDGGCKYSPILQNGAPERPVTNIGWSDAHEYAAWLSKKTGKSYRLPSEAEWEYAARGGTTTNFYWGNTVGVGNANCADCGANVGRQSMPVKSFSPNGFGLYDMAGNAAEWIEDCWNQNYKGAPSDGSAWTRGACEQRVLRGGSFDSASNAIKVSSRFRYDADVRYYANGLRVVRDMQ
jgi:formylglycine-generating enzyme required for sulfatase activity